MSQANPLVKFTYQDYLLLPEDKRYELIEGEFYVAPSPEEKHQSVSGELYIRLRNFIKERNLGKIYYALFDVVLSQENVVQPDILFISKERRGIITTKNVLGAPDLVVEILSSSTSQRDLTLKRNLYWKYGVREYWIVNPDGQSVEVCVLGDAGMQTHRVFPKDSTLTSSLLPGLDIDLREVFAPLP